MLLFNLAVPESSRVCNECGQGLVISDFPVRNGYRQRICRGCYNRKRVKYNQRPDRREKNRQKSAAVYLDPERKLAKLAQGKLWREKHPDIKAYMRVAAKKSYHRHYERNKEKQRLKYQQNPEAGRKQRVLANYKIYGITEEDFLRMETTQGGVCAICHRPERRKVRGRVTRLSVDHCHKTGRVRGLLCAHCNSKLSLVEQLVDHMGIDLLIERLRAYLGV